MQEINTKLFLEIHNFAQSAPEFWHFVAGWFGVVLIAGAMLFVLLHAHKREDNFSTIQQHVRELITLFIIPLGAWAVTGFLKFLFAVPRPFEVLDITPLSMPGSMDSFPSGHATFYMALGLAVYRYHKKAGLTLIILSALLAVARIVIGVHYPLDIIGGWVVALVVYKLIPKG